MKENFKIEKELLFKNNIKDVLSISLDSDYSINDNELTGNFLINGEYRIHEVSINREKFNFKIPFKHNIEPDIDLDTVKVEIDNFVYDYKKDELIVNIEYSLEGSRKEVLIFDDKQKLDDFLENREVDIIDEEIKEEKESISKEETKEKEEVEEKEEVVEKKEENQEEIKVEKIDECVDIVEEDDNRIDSSTVVNNIKPQGDNYVTYKVYKVTETDTLESILAKYKVSIETLKEYNDINEIKVNDKIIIPCYE